MTYDDANNTELDKRMKRMEQDIADIKSALLGNVLDGTTGLLGRVRDRERQAENHDLRILSLERDAKHFVLQKEFDELAARVELNEKQMEQWRTQVKTAWWIVTVGGGSGLLALASRLLEIFGG